MSEERYTGRLVELSVTKTGKAKAAVDRRRTFKWIVYDRQPRVARPKESYELTSQRQSQYCFQSAQGTYSFRKRYVKTVGGEEDVAIADPSRERFDRQRL